MREALIEGRERQKRYADAQRRPAPVFKAGDRVLVSRTVLMPREDRDLTEGNRKLAPLFVGPFRVIEKINSNAYRLRLPTTMRSHDVINVRYLRAFDGQNLAAFGRPDEPPPVFVQGDGEVHRPESILKVRQLTGSAGKPGAYQYLVKWVGFTVSFASWLTVEELCLCREMVEEFWAARQEAPPAGALPPDA